MFRTDRPRSARVRVSWSGRASLVTRRDSEGWLRPARIRLGLRGGPGTAGDADAQAAARDDHGRHRRRGGRASREGVTVVDVRHTNSPGCGPVDRPAIEHYGGIPSRTGPDGRWRTDSVPPGVQAVELRLIPPGFRLRRLSRRSDGRARSPKVAALRDQSDRQVLLKGLGIEGRVVDDQGRPIAGVRIDDSTGDDSPLETDCCRRRTWKVASAFISRRARSFS